MQRLETEASRLHLDDHPDESVTAMSYHDGPLHIDIADSSPVEARLLPPKSWAVKLVDIFFASVWPSFPLIDRALFTRQFHRAFTRSAQPAPKWLAVLNLVLAVGSKYYQLAEPVNGKDVNDHLFFSRAVALNASHNMAVEHPDLHQVQIDLLHAVYYLASGQVNRYSFSLPRLSF